MLLYLINYFLSVIIVFAATAAVSENVFKATAMQSDLTPSASLTGAYRPPEIELKYNVTHQDSYCPQSFAKYMVSIRKLEPSNQFGFKHFCAGVIIQTNLIVTAAHCLMRNNNKYHPSSVIVVASTPARLHKTSNTQILKVKKIIFYENFNATSLIDIALLKLREDIQLDNNCAGVMKLPKQRVNSSTNCLVLGWGKLYLNGPLANKILQINVTLHSKEFCAPFLLSNKNSKICASDFMDIEKNPCSGDSGGPLICEGVLTGIVSYGFQCGHGYPTIYTDVYEYSNWIEENSCNSLEFKKFTIWKMLILIILFQEMNE